ncbi:MAG: DUF72 domain-containing protein [Xanthomonadales bacterium]|nr:DUF72 domain-containing protein [Xanthomonadales bacterium]
MHASAKQSQHKGRIRIGISGWRYAPWRGVFYPEDLVQRRELEYAAGRFASIELNGSFYSLQRPKSWRDWDAQTPADFVFAVKGSRFITHLLRLRGIEQALANFLASGLLDLGEKLGPLLWQFPPSLVYGREVLEAFVARLPRDTRAALALARGHDDRVRHASVPEDLPNRPLRHAFEVRHESFRDESFIALLRRNGIALVVADTAGKWPYLEDVTADFMYLRLHGDKELYASGYSPAALDRWAGRILAWSTGGEPADAQRASSAPPSRRAARDVYCYFDNDIKVHAPFDAAALAERLGVQPVRPRDRAAP